MALAAKSKKRVSTKSPHNKRRSGQHHQRNDHYMKTYWPYIPIIAIVAVGLFCNSFLGNIHKSVLGYATDMSIAELATTTNAQRSSNGLGSLALNNQLASAAQAKANDMVARDYWAHNTPDGATPWTFFTAAGYSYQTAGENLAYGFDSSDATVTAWMNSAEHRANILNTTYTDVGFGVANSPDYQGTGPETIVVAEYGSPQPSVAAATSNAPPPAHQPTVTPATQPAPAQSAPSAAANPAAPPASSDNPAKKAPETNTTTTTPGAANSMPKTVASKDVSRVQLLSGANAPWSMFAVSTIATVSLAIFFLRHGLLWHKTLVRGEAFIMKHKLLDIVLVAIGLLGAVLSRSAGLIY